MFVRPSILAAAILVAGIVDFTVAAAPTLAMAPASVAVGYADLNLSSAAGREILDRRIANAAERLCGYAHPLELGWTAAVEACRAETIAATEPQRNAALGRSGTVEIGQADQIVRVNRAAN